jgi:hypothetical protein
MVLVWKRINNRVNISRRQEKGMQWILSLSGTDERSTLNSHQLIQTLKALSTFNGTRQPDADRNIHRRRSFKIDCSECLTRQFHSGTHSLALINSIQNAAL